MFKQTGTSLTSKEKRQMVEKTKGFLKEIMIAQNTDTLWWGEQLVKLVPHTDVSLGCPMSNDDANGINQVDKDVQASMRRDHESAMG